MRKILRIYLDVGDKIYVSDSIHALSPILFILNLNIVWI